MNKQTFIEELKKNLVVRNVADIDDIVADYEEHFARKSADGCTEEETARKLGDPKELAGEFAAGGATPQKRTNFFRAACAYLADLIVVPLLIVAFAWVAGIAVSALSLLFIGLCLIAAPLFPQGVLVIPYLPYLSGALLGASLIAFGLLFGALTAYSALLAGKTAKVFFRWHTYAVTGKKTAPYAVFPLALNKTKRSLRSLTLISVVLFAIAFTAAFVLMVVQAGSVEFWHVWGWFGYVMR